jgi:hypothetical protein
VDLVGQAGDKLKIVVDNPAVIAKANADLKFRSWTTGSFKEQGGVFVGRRHVTSSGEAWTEVVDYIPFKSADYTSAGSFTISTDMWSDANKAIDEINKQRNTDYGMVGWVHSHPQGFGGMMSGDTHDDFINKNFFKRPGFFAYVFEAGKDRNIPIEFNNLADDTGAFFSHEAAGSNFGYFSRNKGIYFKKP